MEKLGKLSRPVVIRLSHLGNVILPMNGIEKEYPLDHGLMLMEDSRHFGFMIVVDHETKQSEDIYRTDHEISGIGLYKNRMQIFERGNNRPWEFDLYGRVLQKNTPTIDFSNQVDEDTVVEGDKRFSEKTITLVIEKNPKDNHIEFDGKTYKRANGLVIGDWLYGIALKNNATGEEIQKIATEETIYGVGPDQNLEDGFEVFENGKYHPWRFDGKGNVISEASFNPNSRKDQAYYSEKYHKKLTLEQKTTEE